ncbi:hypothetical protein [Marinigracilibium pacificum]|uniref:hypothetical protein n=1 Tax=Marinigracilibium pacificum TaxID=2729599 RepID=UPI00146F102E|nr:hypothetical protein [Marinigracilibium pacificum]
MFFLIGILSGCAQDKPEKYSAYKVHPITYQLQILDSLNMAVLPEENLKVKKTVTYNGQEEVVELTDVNWNKELSFLSDFKPEKIFKANALDSTSQNLTTGVERREYVVTDTSYFNIRKFAVELKDDKIKHISAEIKDENILYHTKKVIELDFDPESRMLKQYFYFEQKNMALRGLNEYSIKASIIE